MWVSGWSKNEIFTLIIKEGACCCSVETTAVAAAEGTENLPNEERLVLGPANDGDDETVDCFREEEDDEEDLLLLFPARKLAVIIEGGC